MSETYHDPKPQGASLAAEPISNPTEAPPADPLKNQSAEDLLRQIDVLYNQGDDPARLRELLAAFDVAHQRRINEQLAILQQQDLAELVDLLETKSQAIKVLKAASQRGDLTLRQARLLLSMVRKERRQQRQWLLSERKRLEQKRPPGTRP